MEIIGRRVVLRPLRPEDVSTVAAILREPEVARWWGSVDGDVAELREAVAPGPRADGLVADEDGTFLFGIWLDDALIGYAQAYEEDDPDYRHAGIDLSLATRHHGQGLGSDAVRTLARWLIDARGHHRLVIDPRASNARAIAAYGKVGFRPVGVLRRYERDRDGTWHDGLLMDLLADELR